MTSVLFRIRKFQKSDFDTLWRIDQVCFDPQLAYSRPEMAFYMRRAGAFTLVAESAASGAKGTLPDNLPPDKSVPDKSMSAEYPKNGDSAGTPEILGFIVAELRRQTGHIITIDVIAGARRLGVGSALLEAAEEQLRARGAVAVVLETAVNNEGAIRFYKQKGYFVEKTVRGYYSNQLDALVMEKALVGVR